MSADAEREALLDRRLQAIPILAKRIRAIDAVALRLLLRDLDYEAPGEVQYCGNFTLTAQPSLLHAIDFRYDAELSARAAVLASEHEGMLMPLLPPAPMERAPDYYRADTDAKVVISANLGLLSCRSPLPTYFLQLLADDTYQGPLIKLLDMLDSSLIDDRLASFRPEWEDELAPDWDGTRRDLLRLTALTTPSTLHGLFQRVFPELAVAVRRVPAARPMELPDVVLGFATLGEAAFGGEAEVPVFGLEVTLICAEALSYEDVPWLQEIPKRLAEQVLPLLADSDLDLTVKALLFERGRDAQLDGDSRLGENPLPGGVEGLRRRVMFAGPIPHSGEGEPQRPADRERGDVPR